MEHKIIIEFITAIVALIAVIVPLFKTHKNEKVPSVHISGKNNTVMQDNSQHTSTTFIEHKQVICISSEKSQTSNDGILMIVGMGLFLLLLYTYSALLLHIIYIPLIISALFNVLICILRLKGVYILPIHPHKILNIIFTLEPVIFPLILMVQNKLFLFNIEDPTEITLKFQIGITIFFDYMSIFFLLFAQLSVLIVPHINSQRFKKFMINLSHMWLFATILPIIPIILWYLQR